MVDPRLSLKSAPRQPQNSMAQRPPEPKQRRLMLIALSMLLFALAIVLFRDRDFWFPDTQEADDQEVTDPSAEAAVPQPSAPMAKADTRVNTRTPSFRRSKPAILNRRADSPTEQSPTADDLPFATVTQRTVLPALEVEVVAGDVHKQVHAGSNSVHVDLQPGTSAQPDPAPPVADVPERPPVNVTNAAEHVEMSADTAEVVSRPVNPDYPLLARQMKVQGSVILQALIGRDGLIQNLRVISGPPILASAAQEAVKQWHFKPHLEGTEAVETQANITVNFTISTN
jgi:TonB family protein